MSMCNVLLRVTFVRFPKSILLCAVWAHINKKALWSLPPVKNMFIVIIHLFEIRIKYSKDRRKRQMWREYWLHSMDLFYFLPFANYSWLGVRAPYSLRVLFVFFFAVHAWKVSCFPFSERCWSIFNANVNYVR